MPLFTVTMLVDAWVHYDAEIEAETEAEALLLAHHHEDWNLTDRVVTFQQREYEITSFDPDPPHKVLFLTEEDLALLPPPLLKKVRDDFL